MIKYILLLILTLPIATEAQYQKKRKLYISDISVSNESKSTASDITDEIKQNVLKSYGDYYHVVTDEDVVIMYEEVGEIKTSSNCYTESCRKLVAEAINADEIIYGSVISKNDSIFVNFTNLSREEQKYTIKSTKFISFLKKEYRTSIREITFSLIDPEKNLTSEDSMYFDELTDPTESIMELRKRRQFIIIKEYEKLGDSTYNNKRFENEYKEKCAFGIIWCKKSIKAKGAIEYYQDALTYSLEIEDEELKKLKQDHLQKKIAITKKTGISLLINFVEQLLDKATSLYVNGNKSDARKLIEHARIKMLNSIFTTHQLVESFNVLAKQISCKQIKISHYNYNNYGNVFSGKSFKNSIGIEFVLIPPGEFMMGCSLRDNKCNKDEKPRHKVNISKSFYMSRYEITQGQWKKVMGNNPSHFKSCGDNCPVEQISWESAQKFINTLNKMDSRKYRLPTETEWEYAARGGTSMKYYWGNQMDGRYAWYFGNSSKQIHTVGKKLPNDFGLYDMSGNVWEWVEDCYDNESYNKSQKTEPLNGKCKKHVLRGGSWYLMDTYLRVSNRFSTLSNSWYYCNGLRIVSIP